jgi:hypothetical protein
MKAISLVIFLLLGLCSATPAWKEEIKDGKFLKIK